MNITRAAIENSRVTLVSLFCVLIAGFAYFRGAPKAEDPGFTIRTAQVITQFPGASPERVEQLVTDKLEHAIRQMPELKEVTSTSKSGISVISVSLRDEFRGAAVRATWDSLRRKVDSIQQELPDGCSPPRVNDEFGDVYGIVIGLTGDGYDYAELKEVADDVRDQLLALSGTAKVELYGTQAERIYIEFKLEKFGELGLAPEQLQRALASQNMIASGGSIRAVSERWLLEPTGNFTSLESIRDTMLRLPDSETTVRLGDIADVRRGFVDPSSSRFHATGEPGIALAVSMQPGGDILALGKSVDTLLSDLRKAYPWGVEFELVSTQPKDVQDTIDAFTVSLLQSIGIVLVAMLLFLGVRTGLIVAALLPATIAGTFVIMAAADMGLDKVTLAALVIALGLLVDNGVVLAESALVHLRQGKSAINAAILAANELKMPLLISSLTTIAAFMPLALAENTMGEFLGALAIVLAVTLLISWFTAITVIPLLCAAFLKLPAGSSVAEPGDQLQSSVYRRFRKILLGVLRHPTLSLGAVLVAAVGCMALFPLVPKRFMADSSLPSFTIELKGPRGTDIESTTAATTEIERWLADEVQIAPGRPHGLVNWASYIGNGGPRFYLGHTPEEPSAEYALIVANADSGATAAALVPQIRGYVSANYPDLEAIVKLRGSGGNAQAPVGFELSGKDSNQLFALVEQLRLQLEGIPGVVNVRDDWGQRTKKLVVKIDNERLARAQLTHQDVATSLQSTMDGFPVTEFRDGDNVIPTMMRAFIPWRDQDGRPAVLNVFSTATKRAVPLQQVASLDVVWESPVVRRRNGVPKVEVMANLLDGYTAAEVNEAMIPWLQAQTKEWPPGYTFRVTGEAQKSGEANAAIAAKVPLAAFAIIFLLVLQFNSLRRSAIVLVTIPLSVMGVVIGLLACDSYFGFMALLGVLSLAGIVVNNAIVLLDRIHVEQAEGRTAAYAVVASAQKRFRPILLTTGTTILGLIPLLIGDDPMWVPMAISIVFGLALATVLTLAVVPLLYALFFRVSFRDFDWEAEDSAAQLKASAVGG